MKGINRNISISIRGVTLGLLSSFLGSIIFTLIMFVDMPITIRINLIFTFFSFVVSSIPGALGGLSIIHILSNYSKKNNLTPGISSVVGLSTGLIAGIFPTSIIAILFLMTGKVPVIKLIEISLIVITIASIFGTCSGIGSYLYLKKLVVNK